MSLRARLTLLYAVLFLLAGSGLLALSYGLLADRLPKPVNPIKDLGSARLFALCKEKTGSTKSQLLNECRQRLNSEAIGASKTQHDQTLSTMLEVALVGLGAATIGAAGLGWVVGPRHQTDRGRRREPQALPRQRRARAAHAADGDAHGDRGDAFKQPAPTSEHLLSTATSQSRSVDQASAIIEALLTLSAAELSPQLRTAVDLAPLAEDALEAAGPRIATRNLQLDSDTVGC